MIGEELRRRGLAVVLDGRRFARSRGARSEIVVRSSGSADPVAEQIDAELSRSGVLAAIAPDGTVWVLDEGSASEVVLLGAGEASTPQAEALAVVLAALDALAPEPPRKARRRPSRARSEAEAPEVAEPAESAPEREQETAIEEPEEPAEDEAADAPE